MSYPLTSEEKLRLVKEQAKQRGLKVRFDKRLRKTPYRAMNPHAGKELEQPFIKKTLTYGPRSKTSKHKMCMDLNHENIEDYKMKQGWCYEVAHKFANRKQRNFNYMDGKK